MSENNLLAKHYPLKRLLYFLLVLPATALLLTGLYQARLQTPTPTLLLLDRNNQFLAQIENGPHGYGFWPLAELPPRVVAATLALEDRRFYQHPGVDLLAIGRAFYQNLRGGRRISGASTLAMQLARMQNPGARTYLRKAVEATTALLLTARYGREEILRHYLRRVPYGNRIHGIRYAARRYFDKPVADLSWAEIALLSAIPQTPSLHNPLRERGRARAVRRGLRILDTLHSDRVLDTTEWQLARAQLPALRIKTPQIRPQQALHAILHLQQRLKPQDGPLVRTTLDLALQTYLHQLAQKAMKKWAVRGATNLAIIVLRRSTREVLGWLGSRDYLDQQHAGALDYTQIHRPAGSTLKPFFYALALERGQLQPFTLLQDRNYLGAGIRNADHRYLGPLLPRQALANSRNVPAVALLRRLGIEEGYFFLEELALHHQEKPAHHFGLGMAIGTLPTSLEQLTRAYATLANEGRWQELVWHSKQRAPKQSLLSATSARLITLFLSDPQARLPSFPRMGNTEYPFPVALKTGTSQGYRDAWTFAYSSEYLVGIWLGRADSRGMNHLGGAASAAELTQTLLLHLHQDHRHGLSDLSFPPPQGYVSAPICTYTGNLASYRCDSRLMEWFSPENPPPESEIHPQRRETTPANKPQLRILSPQNKIHLLRNPLLPKSFNTLSLQVEVLPPVAQVLWYLNGEPYTLADPTAELRWPLRPGTHQFQVKIPYHSAVSQIVTIQVE